jgi:hypothetical protein
VTPLQALAAKIAAACPLRARPIMGVANILRCSIKSHHILKTRLASLGCLRDDAYDTGEFCGQVRSRIEAILERAFGEVGRAFGVLS